MTNPTVTRIPMPNPALTPALRSFAKAIVVTMIILSVIGILRNLMELEDTMPHHAAAQPKRTPPPQSLHIFVHTEHSQHSQPQSTPQPHLPAQPHPAAATQYVLVPAHLISFATGSVQ